jgi:HTH-type transcriptional regulator/antitoxin HigA
MTKGIGNMVSVLEKPQFKRAWTVVGAGLSIKTEHDHQKAIALLDRLLDEIGENEHHPFFGFLEVLGTLVESYESDHIDVKGATGKDVLKFLIEENGLTQSDLPEIGSQGVVSEIVHGKRELNARQIKALSERFGVSPAAFF